MVLYSAHGVHIYEYFTQKTSVPEYVIAKCCQQLVGALEYLHNKDIAHLAIKVGHKYVVIVIDFVCIFYSLTTC